jgi:3-hydroxymyristoyl/3-hydroxydecanoyl-(acyl carrier protein) dehydratase
MDGHFRAFSFVDRITHVEPGARIHGCFANPPTVDGFPASLVAEATGQLAAWCAMAAIGFTHRPVAGIAGRIELLSAVRPGQVMDLAAELESVDTETVGYSGTAYADGAPVLRLADCVGPMVPVEEFDDPQALSARFALLSAAGAVPGGFGGLPVLSIEGQGGQPGQSARAILRVPTEALFFADHFPRRPVFPGTLLMQANLQTAERLAAEVPSGRGARWVPRIVSDVKLRTFISPGETLSLEAKRTAHTETSLSVAVESRINQRLIGSADIQFSPEVHP